MHDSMPGFVESGGRLGTIECTKPNSIVHQRRHVTQCCYETVRVLPRWDTPGDRRRVHGKRIPAVLLFVGSFAILGTKRASKPF
jgi:hypothetical protein